MRGRAYLRWCVGVGVSVGVNAGVSAGVSARGEYVYLSARAELRGGGRA